MERLIKMNSKKNNNHEISVLNTQGIIELREIYIKYKNRDEGNSFLPKEERVKNRNILIADLQKEIDAIIFDTNYIKRNLKNTKIDRNKVFNKKHEILFYLHENGLKNEKESSLETNWGLFNWIAAFYFKLYLRKIENKTNLVTVLWFVCSQGEVEENECYLLCESNKYPSSNHELKRQLIHHHYLYYRKFLEYKDNQVIDALNKYYDTKLNVFNERYEQIYAGGRDRLTHNMLSYIILHLDVVNSSTDSRGGRNLHVLQEHPSSK